ncbi:MAG: hypothetical protein MUP16_12080 [Sedimentisphaerales bacterium]|nr:hypothetical protein [Sedimentisphaerales bacterium]
MQKKYLLKLYITGETVTSQKAIRDLEKILSEEKRLCGECKLLVIDVLKDIEAAERDKISVTPTLLKQFPPPQRRIIGELADKEKVLAGLDIIH